MIRYESLREQIARCAAGPRAVQALAGIRRSSGSLRLLILRWRGRHARSPPRVYARAAIICECLHVFLLFCWLSSLILQDKLLAHLGFFPFRICRGCMQALVRSHLKRHLRRVPSIPVVDRCEFGQMKRPGRKQSRECTRRYLQSNLLAYRRLGIPDLVFYSFASRVSLTLPIFIAIPRQCPCD